MFEIKKSKSNKFYFVFRAKNGEVVATSEMYVSKQSAKKGIKARLPFWLLVHSHEAEQAFPSVKSV